MFAVILAQSAATSRAYAARYSDSFDENVDLVGLGLANAAAAAMVVFVGVLQGILLAIALSVVVHLSVGYKPRSALIVKTEDGHSNLQPVDTGAEYIRGLAVYHFSNSLYYANANHFNEEVLNVMKVADPELSWFALDMSAVAEVDVSARKRELPPTPTECL